MEWFDINTRPEVNVACVLRDAKGRQQTEYFYDDGFPVYPGFVPTQWRYTLTNVSEIVGMTLVSVVNDEDTELLGLLALRGSIVLLAVLGLLGLLKG